MTTLIPQQNQTRELLGLISVLVLAALLRLITLDVNSLWLDEALTIQLSSLPMSTLWITAFDPNPPLFYTVEKFVLTFGDSEFLLRLPSAIYNLLTVLFVYKATRLVGNFNGAVFAGLAIALSTSNIQYAQEARAYSLVGMMISISFYGALQIALNSEQLKLESSLLSFLRKGGAAYVLGALGALYSHNVAVFYILGIQVFVFLQFWLDRSLFMVLIKPWILFNGIVFVAWLPWIFASIEAAGRNFNWLRHYDLIEAIAILKNAHGYNSTYFERSLLWLLSDAIIALAIIGGAFRLRGKSKVFVLLSSLLLSSTLVVWLFGYLKPVFMDKTVLWGTIFSAFLMGYLVSTWKAVAAKVATIGLLLIGGFSYYDYIRLEIGEKQEWSSSVSFLNDNVEGSPSVVVCPNYSDASVAYYLDDQIAERINLVGWDRPTGSYNQGKITQEEGYKPINEWIANVSNLNGLKDEPTIWSIKSHCSDTEFNIVETDLVGLGFAGSTVESFKGMQIYKFVKRNQ